MEIDEEDLAKHRSRTKLRVFAAGSFTNIVTGVLVILILASVFLPTPSGVLVTNLSPGGPAETAGIPQWSVITAVNGTSIIQPGNLSTILIQSRPLDVLHIQTSNGPFDVKTQPAEGNASRAFLGINSSPYFATRIPMLLPPASHYLFNTLQWMEILLLGIGLVNMLPLFPFDGDRYFDTILSRLGLKNTKPVRIVASLLSLGLLGSNLLLSYTVFGTVLLR